MLQAGREGRGKFGQREKRMNPHASTSNKDKRKTKAFSMVKHKIREKKGKRSFQEKSVSFILISILSINLNGRLCQSNKDLLRIAESTFNDLYNNKAFIICKMILIWGPYSNGYTLAWRAMGNMIHSFMSNIYRTPFLENSEALPIPSRLKRTAFSQEIKVLGWRQSSRGIMATPPQWLVPPLARQWHLLY